ncbi:hypothetical protein XBKB1_4340005 [Xenorhabdus bovienii str. kraussei Becker Underwood]|uniref:Uncharacterized protein n=1 Tax=Xenorhabdus bovienii str. kraussei Becker Underwood TaxID=1398204 RepID=A0A077Q1X0_XENBV|nr:hypothetical protein XBKB1_4340005 [Xenorhabdus bovienii str. kraussei Becker Underwood]
MALLRIEVINHSLQQNIARFGTGADGVGKYQIHDESMAAFHIKTRTVHIGNFTMHPVGFANDSLSATLRTDYF